MAGSMISSLSRHVVTLLAAVILSSLIAACSSASKAAETEKNWDLANSQAAGGSARAPVAAQDQGLPADDPRRRPLSPDIVPVSQRIVPGNPLPVLRTDGDQMGYPEFDSQLVVNVTVSSRSVSEFINAVFGDLLGLGFVLGPGVEQVTEQIALRSVQSMPSRDLFDLAINALEDYGIGVYTEDDILHFVQYEELRRAVPFFVKRRANETVPYGLRPVVQYVPLIAANANTINEALLEAFPDRDKLSVRPSVGTNSITLSGMPNQVNAALEIIDTLDVPYFAGVAVRMYRPSNWLAADLMRQLNEQLTVEGFSVSTAAQVNRTINLLAIPETNQISIYTADPQLREYILESARQLDRAAEPVSETRRTHVYRAQFYDVEELAVILDGVVNAMNFGSTAAAPTEAQFSAPPQNLPGRRRGGVVNVPDGSVADESGPVSLSSGRIVVDIQGNRLIFYGTNEEFAAVLDVLQQIDRPGDEVLLEVIIAEVSINDETRSGIEFLFQQVGSEDFAVNAGTLGGLGLAAGALNAGAISGDFTANFSAFASSNQINVLSEPRLVTKSGSAASIQVGTEVPIITSQRGADTQLDGSTDILQSVEYRSTGILLDIEPIVFSDNRIDLSISQEVSSAQPNENQAIASPVFSNRLIITELSLQDGQTAIMGGLIEKRFTRGQTGVPILKDLPVFGRAFRADQLTSDQTVLIVLITPYVLNSPADRQRSLEVLRNQINSAFQRNVNIRSDTLRGPRGDFEVRTQGYPDAGPVPGSED